MYRFQSVRRVSLVFAIAVLSIAFATPEASAQCRPGTLKMTPAEGALPNGAVGLPYSETFTITGGREPYSLKLVNGAFPPGITPKPGKDSTTFFLSGEPTTPGTFSFTLNVTDETLFGACSDNFSYTIAIGKGSCSFTVAPTVLPIGTVGSAYDQELGGNGTAPYSFTATGLPGGLSIQRGSFIGGTPTQSGRFTVIVNGTDARDCAGTASYSLTINCPPLTISSGLAQGRVGAPYSDSINVKELGTFTFALASGALPAGLNLASNGAITGTPTTPGTSSFVVRVTNAANGCSDTQTVSLKICDNIVVNPASFSNGTVGTAYSASLSASGGAAPHTFTVFTGALPAGLSLSGNTISGTPTTAGTFTFGINATDATNCGGQRAYSITIAAPAPQCPNITLPTSLPNGTTGSPYNGSVAATGSKAIPYSYSLAKGLLPPGLSLTGDAITGTPTTAGFFTFSISAKDTEGCTGGETYTVNIVEGCGKIFINPSTLPGGSVKTPYQATFSAIGGAAPYSFAVKGELPTGLRLEGDTILGIPERAGTFTFDVFALDEKRCDASRTYSITITEEPCPTISFKTDFPAGEVGTGYKGGFLAGGGTEPYKFAISGGVLPPGLSLDGTTISGTPTTQGSFRFTINAQDARGCTGSTSVTIDIAPAPGCPTITVNPLTLPGGTVGLSYKTAVGATGGAIPYSYTVTGGSLPPGLSLTDDTIGGLATAAGTFSFTITARDAKGCSGSRNYSITIAGGGCPTITVGPAQLPAGVAGTDYKAGLSATGGAAPYSFALTAGALPSGLSLEGSTIVGTPTSAGSFKFSITAADANKCTGSTTYLIDIQPAENCTIQVTPSTLPNAAVGASYKVILTATGGAAPYSFAADGALPPGLFLDGNIIGGIPETSGTFVFNIRVGDARRCSASVSYSLTVAPKPTTTCPTGTPSNATPTPGQTLEGATSVLYSWDGVSNAQGYDVFVSSDGGSTFTREASTSGAVSTRVVVPAKTGRFVWFVRANFGVGCRPTDSRSTDYTVTLSSTCPNVSGPTQLQPANNAQNVSTTAVFEWTRVEGASSYTVLASFNDDPMIAVATTTDTIVKASVKTGKVVWAVRAEFPTKCPAVQSTSNFTFFTEQAAVCSLNPPKAILDAPGNGASGVASPVTFSWRAVSGATGYNVTAVVDTGNALIRPTTQTLGSTDASTTSLTVPSVPEGTITWQVQTLFGRCPSSTSDSFVFKSTGSGAACNNPATRLGGPSGNVSSPVTFSWEPQKGAVLYRLFVRFEGSRLPTRVEETTGSSLTRIISPGTHIWFLETDFFGCTPVKSAEQTFTVTEATKCATESVTLKSPVGATVNSPVTFDWTTLSGVEAYRLTVTLGSTTVFDQKVPGPPQTLPMSAGTGSWTVTPLASGCTLESSSARFSVQPANTCDQNVAPQPQSPTGARIETTSGQAVGVTFTWSAVPNATGYALLLSSDGQPFGEIASTLGNNATSVRRDIKPGNHAWRVAAIFPGCNPLVSPVEGAPTFSVVDTSDRCATAAPSLIFPSNGDRDVTSPTTFLWSSVTNAIGYRVYVNDKLLTLPDLDASQTSFTATLSPGDASWTVEAVFKGCTSTKPASPARFAVRQAQVCPSDKPEQVFPRQRSENVSQSVEFSWRPVSGATKYFVVTKSANGIETPSIESTTTSALAKMPSGEDIEWYVIASVPGCNPIESNEHFFFRTAAECSDRAPVLQAPADTRDLGNEVTFAWTFVPGASEYNLWIGDRNDFRNISLVKTTTALRETVKLDAGAYRWFVEAVFPNNCPTNPSAIGFFAVAAARTSACSTPEQPSANSVGQVLSDTEYNVRFNPVVNAASYEVQESATMDFSTLVSTATVKDTFAPFTHTVSVPTTFFYRVRAISSCNDDRGQFSVVVPVNIVPQNAINTNNRGTAEIGVQQIIVQTLTLTGTDPATPFSATVDKQGFTVTPSTGSLGSTPVTFTISANPEFLGIGSNNATLILTYGGAGKLGQVTNGGPTSVPVNVSLVTPVVPGGKNSPTADSLIIPAVGHAQGANNALFQSDLRVVNTSTQTMKYQLLFTASRTDATQTGKSTIIQIEPGGTAALDDVLTSFFGTGSAETATGALEIRPLTSSSNSSSSKAAGSFVNPTVASSRTYNLTSNGTLGQFIPAIPFANFIGKNSDGTRAILSLQQVAESRSFRTNFGLVEGSGQPASGLLSVFDKSNSLIAEIPFDLKAGEHQQINSILAVNNISLDEGRIEVEVMSDTGKVTAYASTVDNATNDPLLISPVLKSGISGTRYVIPGVAFIDGATKWRSDVRVFNAANTATTATVTFFPQGNTAGAQSQEVTINAGEVLALDNVLVTMFGATSTITGSLLVTTPQTSSLVATARTYAVTANGTYGQFVPGVTPNESTAMGARSLNILQVEQSINMRTNIGLVETSGRAAIAEVSLILPDTKVTPRVQVPLDANGFTQFNLASFNVGAAVYNARVSVKVISGSGRVAAYGSVVDNKTLDPTYVPAQ